MSGCTGHCPVRGFYEVYLNFGVARVGPENVRLGQIMSSWRFLFVDDLEGTCSCSTRLFFTSSITPLLKVRYSYTQEI
jgi:hypothetical protein